jgi:hypothetical protein
MVTIKNLEVQFDVEGEGDEAVFTRLFDKHIKVWDRMKTEAKARQRFTDAERSLGDSRQEAAD